MDVNHVCDLCGMQSTDEAKVIAHAQEAHGIENASQIGTVETTADGILTINDDSGMMVVNLQMWLAAVLLGGDPELAILSDTRTHVDAPAD